MKKTLLAAGAIAAVCSAAAYADSFNLSIGEPVIAEPAYVAPAPVVVEQPAVIVGGEHHVDAGHDHWHHRDWDYWKHHDHGDHDHH